jgi:hypothetical protein
VIAEFTSVWILRHKKILVTLGLAYIKT